MSIQKIAIIGSGRVATQLALNLAGIGKTITQVFSRKMQYAVKLADKVGAVPLDNLRKINPDADLYLIATVDDAIAEIARQLNLENKLIAHTSGSVAMNVLSPGSSEYGVFYPLQTFAKDRKVNFKDIPVCIEGTTPTVEKELESLANEISDDVRFINSEQRLKIHIAAVFANNFTNFMFLMGEEVLKDAGVSFDILLPLIRETVNKVAGKPPHESQTGPAMRGDEKVIQKHLKVLAGDRDKQEIYRKLSGYIRNYFKSEIKD